MENFTKSRPKKCEILQKVPLKNVREERKENTMINPEKIKEKKQSFLPEEENKEESKKENELLSLEIHEKDDFAPFYFTATIVDKSGNIRCFGQSEEVLAFNLQGEEKLIKNEAFPNIREDIHKLTEDEMSLDEFIEEYDTETRLKKEMEVFCDDDSDFSFSENKLLTYGEQYRLSAKTLRKILDELENNKEIDKTTLKNFCTKLYKNTNAYVREQLLPWFDYMLSQDITRNFVICPDGDFLAYKGVQETSDGNFLSVHSGTAFVNGHPECGRIPNAIGNIITMPRESIVSNPNTAYSFGLHAGTYDYASSFAPVVLLVKISPEDVCSVPTDASCQKIRCCKYEVIKKIKTPITDVFTIPQNISLHDFLAKKEAEAEADSYLFDDDEEDDLPFDDDEDDKWTIVTLDDEDNEDDEEEDDNDNEEDDDDDWEVIITLDSKRKENDNKEDTDEEDTAEEDKWISIV